MSDQTFTRGVKTLDFAGTKEVVYERSDWPLPKLQEYFKHDTLALIGYGFMGAAHSVGWRQAPRVFSLPEAVEMAVVVGRNAGAVADAAAQWGWQESATDWRDVIARDDIDIVDIVTPGDSHAEIAIAALEAGKHVLCEKPFTANGDEAAAVVEVAQRTGLVVMEAFHHRYHPLMERVVELLQRREIGELRSVDAWFRARDWPRPPRPRAIPRYLARMLTWQRQSRR